jgi:hypothetical protein
MTGSGGEDRGEGLEAGRGEAAALDSNRIGSRGGGGGGADRSRGGESRGGGGALGVVRKPLPVGGGGYRSIVGLDLITKGADYIGLSPNARNGTRKQVTDENC